MTPIPPTQLRPFSVSNAPEETYRLQQMTTLTYEDGGAEEEIAVPKFPDIDDLSTQQKAQALAIHLKSVIGAFLQETRTGREDFVLHGSTAIAMNLLSQLSAETVRAAELERRTPSECLLPLYENEQSNLDVVCKKTEPSIESIVRLLESALKGFDNNCQIEVYDSPIEINSILDDPSAYRKDMKQVLLTTGYTQKIMAKYEGENILSLNITYPPTEEPSAEFKYNRPYCKDSRVMSVKLGERYVEINVNSLEQSIHDIYHAIKSKTHLSNVEKKPSYWIRVITKLSVTKELSGKDGSRIVSIIAAIPINKGQKLVKSSCQQTQHKETKDSETNTETKTKVERQDRLAQTTIVALVEKASMTDDIPKALSSYTQTDSSHPCDPDRLPLGLFSDMAVQTEIAVQDPVEIPLSSMYKGARKKNNFYEGYVPSPTKSTLDTEKAEENKVRNPKEIAKEIKIIINKKAGVNLLNRKNLYSDVKRFCDIKSLTNLYKELLSVVTLEKCLDVFCEKEYIDIFDKQILLFMEKVELVKKSLARLHCEKRYEVKVLLSLCVCNLLGVAREADLVRHTRILNSKELPMKIQNIDAFYCEAMITNIDWVDKEREHIAKFCIEVERLIKELAGYFHKFIALYPHNFLMRSKKPLALNVIMDAFFKLTGRCFLDMYLLYLELIFTGKKYREMQKKHFLMPSLKEVSEVLGMIASPVAYGDKLLSLSKMAAKINFFFYSGVIRITHIRMMIFSSEYRQECHKKGFFQVSESRYIFDFYDRVIKGGPEIMEGMSEEFVEENRRMSELMANELLEESNKLIEILLSESYTIFYKVELTEMCKKIGYLTKYEITTD